AGLIDGSKLYADSSLVRADASLNSVVRTTLAKLDEAAGDEPKKAQMSVNASYQAATDPDSALVRHTNGKSLPSYKNHRALDAKTGVITASRTTNGVRDDGAELGALVSAHQEKTGLKPKAVVADCKYGTSE